MMARYQLGVKLIDDRHDTLMPTLGLVNLAKADSSPDRQCTRLDVDVSTSKPADLTGPKACERREHDSDSMLGRLAASSNARISPSLYVDRMVWRFGGNFGSFGRSGMSFRSTAKRRTDRSTVPVDLTEASVLPLIRIAF
jgi:hypothetical protein